MTKFILVYNAEAHSPLHECRRMVGASTLARTLYNCYRLNESLKVGLSGTSEHDKLRSNDLRGQNHYHIIIIDECSKARAISELKRILSIQRKDATSVQFIEVDASYGKDNNAPPHGPSYVSSEGKETLGDYLTIEFERRLAEEIPQKVQRSTDFLDFTGPDPYVARRVR